MTKANETLVRAFEAHALDPSAFHHEDHVYVAYALLRKSRFLDAATNYARCIDAMAIKAGAPDKFNITITFAFMSLIAERMARTDHTDYEDFIFRNPDLLSKDVLETWYTPARLYSDSARSAFLMPDRPGAIGQSQN